MLYKGIWGLGVSESDEKSEKNFRISSALILKGVPDEVSPSSARCLLDDDQGVTRRFFYVLD
jgi:hypothetical protein